MYLLAWTYWNPPSEYEGEGDNKKIDALGIKGKGGHCCWMVCLI